MLARLIALFPALLPLYLVKGTFLGVPVNLPEMVLALLGFAFLFEHPPFRAFSWRLPAVFLFFVAAIWGVFAAGDALVLPDGAAFPSQLRAFGILKGWILAPMLYFFMARATFRDKASLVGLALQSLTFGGLGLAVFALYQVWSGDFLTPDGRASGPFESANYLALYLGPLLVYAVLFTVREVGHAFKRPRSVGGSVAGSVAAGFLAVLILGLAVFFSKSYAAYLAVFGSLALYFLMEARRRFPDHWRWGFVFALGCFVLLVFSQMGSPKFQQALDFTGQSSSSVRLQVYTVAAHFIAEHPLGGLGLGQFEPQYLLQAESILGQAPMEKVMLHAHNLFLMTWISMGALGLFALLWLLKDAFLWFFEKPDLHQRRLVAFMMLTLVLHGFFDTPMFKNDLAFQFWMFLAILL